MIGQIPDDPIGGAPLAAIGSRAGCSQIAAPVKALSLAGPPVQRQEAVSRPGEPCAG